MNIGISDGRTFSANYDPTMECGYEYSQEYGIHDDRHNEF
jgi:hypothetical protein